MGAQLVVVFLQKKGIMFEILLDEQEDEDIKEELEVQKKEDINLVEVKGEEGYRWRAQGTGEGEEIV